MPYSPLLVKPMREELTAAGLEELKNSEEVDQFMSKGGTSLLVINSVCGCAAGSARPAVRLAMQHATLPDQSATVFAGQDLDATSRSRAFFPDVPPSSPSVAFFKDGDLVYFIPRHRIENRSPEMVSEDLKGAFDRYCE